jgi:Fe-S oxidoreductase
VLQQTAVLVKKYNGSLSGEHGDGRLRGEFIPYIMGEKIFELFRQVKKIFDQHGVFNYGKIVDTPPMNEFLRYKQDEPKPIIKTVFDFSIQEGILHLAEKCSGSGDCRKTQISGGTMCPSYMATRSERDTTRARANMLRHFYTHSHYANAAKKEFEEVKDILDLCLSCKGCKSECPSSVDVGKMKAEFTQQYHDRFGIPVRSKLIGSFTKQMKLASAVPWAYNFIFNTPLLRRFANNLVGFHPKRSMPLLHKTTLRKWYNQHQRKGKETTPSNRTVYLFGDEFTHYNDVEVGQKLILLLEKLGYKVIMPKHSESGRTYLSKGLVKEAQKIAIKNVDLLKDIIKDETPIIGIEPSAILTLRDEYPDLVSANQKLAAKQIAKNTFLFDEWFVKEIELGNIKSSSFTTEAKIVQVHGHCHQKALSSVQHTIDCLSLPVNYKAVAIPSGCCGMAGSFGYEKEHYDVSMQIGELVLFPTIRKLDDEVLIAAPGTSCRHQIKDGTGKKAMHTAEILFEALINK